MGGYVSIQDNNQKANRVIKELQKLKGAKLKVGVMGENNQQSDEADMVTIASVHEFGVSIEVTEAMRGWFMWKGFPLSPSTTEINIPERSFIRKAFDKNKKDLRKKANRFYTQVIKGNMTAEMMMDKLGTWCVRLVQETIDDVDSPPLSGMTQQMRKGNEGSPLQDTGKLWQSIQYEVEW